MSKSERAMLNTSFFGVFFLIAMLQPMNFSHLAWFDEALALAAGTLVVAHGFRYLYLIWKEKW